MSLFWLTHRHLDGRAAGVVVIESAGLLHARLKAALVGVDRDLEFVSGHQLDPISAAQVPANMIGRFLDDGELGCSSRPRSEGVLGRGRPVEGELGRGTKLGQIYSDEGRPRIDSDQVRLTAINRSLGCLTSAPLAMASASLVASSSPSHTAFERRTRIDHRAFFRVVARILTALRGKASRAAARGLAHEAS